MASKLNFTFRLGVPKVRFMYIAITNDIQVTALPDFLPERSDPAQNRYFWSYTIEIANLGRERVQLLSRHWIIIDANGRREEVRGPGVVGEQPVLEPGETFRYASGCPARDALRDDAGQLSHGHRRRRDLRHRGSGLFARQSLVPPDAELTRWQHFEARSI